jgi:hypothetical protein
MNMLRFSPAPLEASSAPCAAAAFFRPSTMAAISSVSMALPIAAKLRFLSAW